MNLCEEGDPMACSPLVLLTLMHLQELSQLGIAYSATIRLCKKGPDGMPASGVLEPESVHVAS